MLVIVEKGGFVPHPKFKGRYILPDRPGSVTSYSIEDILNNDNILAVNLDKTTHGYFKFFETILSIYRRECDLDENGNAKLDIGYIYGAYTELHKV